MIVFSDHQHTATLSARHVRVLHDTLLGEHAQSFPQEATALILR